MTSPLLMAKSGDLDVAILPKMANRHGVVTGATGTGKTVSMQTLCELFSSIGVRVFVADVKGDVAGLSQPGGGNDKVDKRLAELGLPPLQPAGSPVMFWDVFGKQGHPARCTITQMGPVLLSRLLELNDTQTGVMQVAFAWADEQGWPVIDLKDLRALLVEVSERRKELGSRYGSVSPNSVAAIQRSLLQLEEAGGDVLFGEPALDLTDFMRTTADGRGYVNVLAVSELIRSPLAYSTFLLWLLSELFEILPEVGDPDKPVMVFFFDEAHLLFEDVPKSLGDKIEQVVRQIRSKGVGVCFVSQMPTDMPDPVLGQLAHRVQHALRAYTAREQRAVKAVAETFRANPDIDVETAVLQLGVGETLISFLDDNGVPGVVESAKGIPPRCRIGTITEAERAASLAASPVAGRYEQAIDRESAYEILQKRMADAAEEELVEQEREEAEIAASKPSKRRSSSATDDMTDIVTDMLGMFSKELGRQIGRGILGSLSRR